MPPKRATNAYLGLQQNERYRQYQFLRGSGKPIHNIEEGKRPEDGGFQKPDTTLIGPSNQTLRQRQGPSDL